MLYPAYTSVCKLPAYLASINPKKVKPELRAKIGLYQAESDDVLWDYWINGRAESKQSTLLRNPTSANSPLTPDQQCTLHAIVKSKVEAIPEAERPKGIYPQIWSRFNNHFRIARYCQLPQSRLSEAIDYLVRLEIRSAAIGEGAHPLNGPPGFDVSKMPQSFGIIFDKAEKSYNAQRHLLWQDEAGMSMQEQAKMENPLTQTEYRIRDWIIGEIGIGNYVYVNQAEVGRQLRITRSHVSEAIKRLIELEILLQGPKSGRSNAYMVNPAFCFSGNLNAGIKARNKVIQENKAKILKFNKKHK